MTEADKTIDSRSGALATAARGGAAFAKATASLAEARGDPSERRRGAPRGVKNVAFGVLALVVCGLTSGIRARQQPSDLSKPKVPIVSVVGCASRTAEGTWILTNATDGIESKVLFMSGKEIEEARKKALGKNRYTLLGTPEFLAKEELLKQGQRAEFTRPEVANATGQLQAGRKLIVKGLLITAPNEKRLNLVAVQQLADTCK